MILITDTDAQRAADYLRDSAEEAAEARANRVYVTEYRKSLKSMIMLEHDGQSLGVQEREAYADQRYLDHLVALKDAVKAEAKHQFLREAADAKISAWQTMSKHLRSSNT